MPCRTLLPSLVLVLLLLAVPATQADIMTGSLHFRYFQGPMPPNCDLVGVFVDVPPGVDPDETCIHAWRDWVLSQGFSDPQPASSSPNNSTGGP